MEIRFNNREEKEFLLKLGYTIKLTDVFEAHNEYHNSVEFEHSQVEVAFKGVLKIEDKNKYTVLQTYGVTKVFEREFKEALKELY